jgi:hypothetical protein
MQPWKNESQFGDFIAKQLLFYTAPSQMHVLYALQIADWHLQQLKAAFMANGEDTKAISQLMNFVHKFLNVTPSHTEERFEILSSLSPLLFWLPVMFLRQAPRNPFALVNLAYYYTVALIIEPIFPEVGSAYFGSLSLQPIEEITHKLLSSGKDLQTMSRLIEYPRNIAILYRARMEQQQPEQTAPFPLFQQIFYDISSNLDSSNAYRDNAPFSNSHEHPTLIKSEPISPLSLVSLELPTLGIVRGAESGPPLGQRF